MFKHIYYVSTSCMLYKFLCLYIVYQYLQTLQVRLVTHCKLFWLRSLLYPLMVKANSGQASCSILLRMLWNASLYNNTPSSYFAESTRKRLLYMQKFMFLSQSQMAWLPFISYSLRFWQSRIVLFKLGRSYLTHWLWMQFELLVTIRYACSYW